MNSNLQVSEALRAYQLSWGRIQPLRWCAGWDFSCLNSARTLWTVHDLFPSANCGTAAHLGICFKSLGFQSRRVRGLIDVASEQKIGQCTLWFTRTYPLALKTDRGWRIAYHKQLLEFEYARLGVKLIDLIARSLEDDLSRANPLHSSLAIRVHLARKYPILVRQDRLQRVQNAVHAF